MRKQKYRVSILIPVHNEEKLIGECLKNLSMLPLNKFEIIVGLDGCTDRTEKIAKKFGFVRIIKSKERVGKAEMLNILFDHAMGEFLIIHDVDWRFIFNKDSIGRFLEDIGNESLGGIVLPPHNLPFLKNKSIANNEYLNAAVALHYFHKFLLEKQTKLINGRLHVDKTKLLYPFPVNIIRNIPMRMKTVADDLERFYYLIDSNYDILIYNTPTMPYFEIVKKSFTREEHIRRRIRGHITRKQLEKFYRKRINYRKLYISFMIYVIKNIPTIRSDVFKILAWQMRIIQAYLKSGEYEVQSPLTLWEMRDGR